MASKKLWGGRFSEETDARVAEFTQSVDDDKCIAREDVHGSLAHARMLERQGLIQPDTAAKLKSGLEQVRDEIEAGRFPWRAEYEDVHMNIEARLGELVGTEVSGQLHTARSRNDQVALDLKLYLRSALAEVRIALLGLEEAFVLQGEAHVDTFLPGYTHLQRGQPVRLTHHLLAYREMFSRDRARIDDLLGRLRASPLGSGALAATPHPIDREGVAHELGFSEVTRNSMDAVSDRDHVFEALSAASLSMVHLSRLSEELILWASSEFGFVRISDAFSTGSSMMPQKKNPDVAELVRGRCGRVAGHLINILVTLKGLPLTYNRDLQEDKPALYDGVDTWRRCLEVTAEMVKTLSFVPEAMHAALDEGYVLATELADYLVTKNVPFRVAHEVVGRLVGDLVPTGRTLSEVSVADLKTYHEAFDAEVAPWLDVEQAVDRRNVVGGPAKTQVVQALAFARRQLEEEA